MGITCYPLPQNNCDLPLPFFGGNFPIVLLDNIINYNTCILPGSPVYYYLIIIYVVWKIWG